MTVIFPDNQLKIFDYNRVVKDLNGHTIEEFFEKIEEKFEIEAQFANGDHYPKKLHEIGMYINKTWYRLIPKPGSWDFMNVVASLDVSILQDNLLDPILGIKDPRKDQRIDFIGGIRGLKSWKDAWTAAVMP